MSDCDMGKPTNLGDLQQLQLTFLTGFQQDLNVLLPRERLNELQHDGTIAKAADTHYSFMGATDPHRFEGNARALGQSMLGNGVNTLVLAPV